MSNDSVAAAIVAGAHICAALPNVVAWCHIGSSRYLPSPRDVDYLVLVPDPVACGTAGRELENLDFEPCGDYDGEEPDCWGAWKNGILNIILTHDPEHYKLFVRAMAVCEVLHLTAKDERVAVCRLVRDGKSLDGTPLEMGYVLETLPVPAPAV